MWSYKHKTFTAMITYDKVIEIFYIADEYSKEFLCGQIN